ncbi:hypothetical protein [Streptomyces sp. NPDC055058]
MTAPIPRLFVLRRDQDVTGVSGPGDVADGVQWPDGTVALRWRERPSTSLWDNLELMLSVHGHDGATRVVWLEDEEARQRDRAQAAAGRAYKLADRWQAAHGQSSFLVHVAGSELRDELDGPECGQPATGIRGLLGHVGIDTRGRNISVAGRVVDAAEPQHDRPASSCTSPDHVCGTCGECTYEHPGGGGCTDSASGAHAELEQAHAALDRTRAVAASIERSGWTGHAIARRIREALDGTEQSTTQEVSP